MDLLRQAYFKLLEQHGMLGWWPLIDRRTATSRYHTHEPKTDAGRLEISIGAVLTQNTAWSNAEKALLNLHKHNLTNIERLQAIPEQKLARLIRSSGYYNQKARKIKALCEFLTQHPFPSLKRMQAGKARILLLSVNGIGPETADSILLYALEQPVFVIDSYTRRVFSRLGIVAGTECPDGIRTLVEQTFARLSMKERARVYNEYHALIVTHCKLACRKRPECRRCPLTGLCELSKTDSPTALAKNI